MVDDKIVSDILRQDLLTHLKQLNLIKSEKSSDENESNTCLFSKRSQYHEEYICNVLRSILSKKIDSSSINEPLVNSNILAKLKKCSNHYMDKNTFFFEYLDILCKEFYDGNESDRYSMHATLKYLFGICSEAINQERSLEYTLDNERYCINKIAKCELNLEMLRFDIAIQLATTSKLSNGSFQNDSSEDNCSSKITNAWNINNSLKTKMNSNTMSRQNLLINSYEVVPDGHAEDISNGDSNFVESFEIAFDDIFSNIKNFSGTFCCLETEKIQKYPSDALSHREYKQLLIKLPVLCFMDYVSIIDSVVIPNIKQDSKDLLRDSIIINGSEFCGSIGYQTIYEKIALELLPPQKKDKLKDILNSKLLISDRNGIYDIEFLEEGSDLFDVLIAQLHALIILHLVNRTISCGNSFDKLMKIFNNEKICHVKPNSQEAKPLNVVILPYLSSYYVMLKSHTQFDIFLISDKNQIVELCKEKISHVVAYNIINMDLQKTSNLVYLDYLCHEIMTLNKIDGFINLNKSTPSNSELTNLSKELLYCISKRAGKYCDIHQQVKNESNSVMNLNVSYKSRVYLENIMDSSTFE